MRSADFFELRRLVHAEWRRSRVEAQFRLAGCVGKDAFGSHAEAERRLRRMRERHQRAAINGAHVYHCRYCGQWHLGTKR